MGVVTNISGLLPSFTDWLSNAPVSFSRILTTIGTRRHPSSYLADVSQFTSYFFVRIFGKNNIRYCQDFYILFSNRSCFHLQCIRRCISAETTQMGGTSRCRNLCSAHRPSIRHYCSEFPSLDMVFTLILEKSLQF